MRLRRNIRRAPSHRRQSRERGGEFQKASSVHGPYPLNVPAGAREVDLIRRPVTLRRMNSISLRISLAVFGIVLSGCATGTKSQDPTTTTAAASTQPSYPVTYAPPTVEQLTRTLV